MSPVCNFVFFYVKMKQHKHGEADWFSKGGRHMCRLVNVKTNFNTEIEKLTNELNRLSGGNTAVTKTGCIQLSQKISSLTRSISEAAVYRNSARTIFMVNSKQPAKPTNTRVDIML